MPYITQTRRLALEDEEERPQNAGELNYAFTLIAMRFFKDRRNYQAINDVIGALEGCKLEFYRRIAVPYEDVKIAENGDVL